MNQGESPSNPQIILLWGQKYTFKIVDGGLAPGYADWQRTAIGSGQPHHQKYDGGANPKSKLFAVPSAPRNRQYNVLSTYQFLALPNADN